MDNTNTGDIFIPYSEEQTALILKEKCPHNERWIHIGHYHNSDVYKCHLCSELEFF